MKFTAFDSRLVAVRSMALGTVVAVALSACGGSSNGSTPASAGSGSSGSGSSGTGGSGTGSSGGSGSSGSGSGSSTPTLSAAQSSFESIALASNGGLHELLWNLPASGLPANGRTPPQFIVDITSGGMKASPLTAGTQSDPATWTSLSSLDVPELPLNLPQSSTPAAGPVIRLPDMVVQPSTGEVLVVSSDPTDQEQVSYVGSNIQIDILAVDGHSIAYSTVISAVTPVSVAGQSITAATDTTLSAWLGAYNLTSNTSLIKNGATFASGSQYVKLDATYSTDTLFVADCALAQTSTTSAALVPCQSNTTLAATTTENNISDGSGGGVKSWNLQADGQICSPSSATSSCPNMGVTYWVATTPRTTTMNVPADTSGSYRAYMELNGNIYVGELIRSGAPVWQNIGSQSAPNVQPFFLRANQAFVESLKSSLNF